MMKYVESITDLVGDTPLLKLNRLSEETGANVYAKLEFFNPLGSVKDRIALAMIDAAEASGELKPGGTIVEPTSGNTGIGLAFVAASRGYNLILTMPESMSLERRRILKVLGAELVLTPADKGMKGAIDRAEELHAQTPGSIMARQFSNPANPYIHRRTTAQEIWQALDGQVDVFAAAVGTGGSFSGTGLGLKEKNPQIYLAAVEPEESPVLSGGSPAPHRIQGIGAGFVPDNMQVELANEVITISSENAAAAARELAAKDGVLVGISSGANYASIAELAKRPENKGKNLVTFFCDTGERYLSTWIFDV
jgi:cysteine synthase A